MILAIFDKRNVPCPMGVHFTFTQSALLSIFSHNFVTNKGCKVHLHRERVRANRSYLLLSGAALCSTVVQ